jgi:hypothetical protein
VLYYLCAKYYLGKIMKNRKEFDNILEECLERILTGGETIEQCLASYPEQATELEPLLQTALSARETLAIKPRPEFRDRARYQLRTALQEMEEKRQRRFSFFNWQPRWATAVIAVLILVLASGSTVAAASGSMPDEPLYPVKLVTERVQLALTPSVLGKAELHAKLADKRVTEIVKMADEGRLELVEQTARRLNEQLMVVAVLVSPEGREAVSITPTPEAVQAPSLPAVAEKSQQERPGLVLAPAPPEAPPEVPSPSAVKEPRQKRPDMMMAPTLPVKEEPVAEKPELRAVPAQPAPRQASELQPAPPVLTPERAEADTEGIEVDRRAKLRMTVMRNLAKHREALRTALERAPESARPALLRAIAASDAEYEKILEALKERLDGTEEEDDDGED